VREIARLTDVQLNLDALVATYAGRGSQPHRPDLLLKLVLYEHSQGRVQPVQWMKDLNENKAVQWLVYGMRPSQTTLYEFRDRVHPHVQNLNRQVIRTAIAEGHTDGSCGSLDGTTVAANATRHRMINLAAVEKRLEILDREIAEAERAEEPTLAVEPAEADGSAWLAETLPDPVVGGSSKPPSWKAKTLRGKKRQRDRCRCALAVLKARQMTNVQRRKDKRKEDAKIKVALGDPMAPFRFSYDPSLPGYRCPEGKPLTYRERTTKQRANGDYFTIEIYQADPTDCARCPLKASCVRGRSGARTVRRQEHEEQIERLKERMNTAAAKERYSKRCCTVERRFADWKTHRGLQRFSGQTPERADAQVALTVLVHNLRTLAKLRVRRSEQMQNTGKIAS
jgi:transposase